MSVPARARSIRVLLVTMLAALHATTAFAQDASRSPNPAPPAGADVIVIIPDSLESAPRTVSELLRDYVPSAAVNRATGAIGASAFVSLRDAAAVRGGDPLVVVDGIRQVSARVSLDTLDRRPSSILDDMMVEDIARIEILPGPAAAASYGHDGAMGAIVITTRVAGSGHPVFSASVTTSGADADANYARNLSRTSANGFACPYFSEALGSCTATATTSYTPILDRSPFRSAQQLRAHLGAIGGLGPLGYAASLGFERGNGTMEADAADRTVASLRLRMEISPSVRIGLSSFASGRGITFPTRGDYSLLANGIGGGPLDCSPATPCGVDSSSGGYGYPITWLEQNQPHRRIGHLSNALTVDADPRANLSLRTSVTADMLRDLESLRDSSPPGGYARIEQITADERSWRVDAAEEARLTGRIAGALATTLLSVRFNADRGRSGSKKAAFAPVYGSTQVVSSISTTDAWLFEDYFSQSLDERLAWGERGALDIGILRTTTDFNQGARPPATIDPHADAMYQLVAPAAPLGALQSLRLRTAWGRTSGQSFWAVNNPNLFLTGVTTPYGGYGYGYAPGSRPHSPAERSTELEGGVDAAFAPASSRLSITAFRRDERLDYLAPLGIPTGRRITGGELRAETTPIERPGLRLHLRGQLAVSHDRLDSNPAAPTLVFAFGPGVSLAAAPGQSWAAWRMQPANWNDTNGNGRIEVDELTPGDISVQGRSRPSNVALLASDLELLRSFTVSAVVDHVGGFDLFDAAAAQQCWRRVCPALNDPNASLAAQARAVAVAGGPGGAGFIVPGDETSLRELSLSWRSPRTATMMHATTLRITLSAYDLAHWTRSKGLHPETDGPAPGLNADLWSIVQPVPRTFALRVALGY